jgi:hypothetical protein
MDQSVCNRAREGIDSANATKLYRLTRTGDPNSWGYAFGKYSDERYELSISLDGPSIESR